MAGDLDSLRDYLGRSGVGPRWEAIPGVVVIGAGKGGVGTSTVASLLALAASQEGRKVLLVDGDEGVGSLHFHFGLQDPGPGLGLLRGGEVTAEDLLRPVYDGLWLLPGGGGAMESSLSLALGERRALFRRVAELYSRYDLVVVDGGSHLASVLAACFVGAERLLTLTSPDRVAMAATYALLKVGRDRFPQLPLEVLVNWGERVTAEEVFRMMALAGERFLGLRVAFAGAIPRDPALEIMYREGKPLPGLPQGSPALEAVGALHGRLMAEQMRSAGAEVPVLSFPTAG